MTDVSAIVGANWGDEGKGKLTDLFAENAQVVVRFQGGCNAGHTVINRFGKFALHLLPSGVFHAHVVNILGPGVAVDVEALRTELEGLIARGVPKPQLLVSDRAQVVLPYHRLMDVYEEERLAGKCFGSTQRGIAPFYSDKYLKIGIQANELFDSGRLRNRLQNVLPVKNALFQSVYHKPALDLDGIIDELSRNAMAIKPFLADTSAFLRNALNEGKSVLLEGQLGALRDPDHGIYPFSTSSSTLAGYAPVGAGIPPHSIKRIIAAVKSYSTCVGAGPFVTELLDNRGDELRRRGGDSGEFGATTGRPRRVGWFDAVASRYGCRVQAATEAALTMLDVLGYLDEIPVCVEYVVGGERTDEFPSTHQLETAEPVYVTLPGWKCDIKDIRRYADLPPNARRYVEFIEDYIGVPIKTVSLGSSRDAVVLR